MKNHRKTYFFNRSAGGQHDPDYPIITKFLSLIAKKVPVEQDSDI